MIKFLHQQREVAIENMAAQSSVLDYLREHCGLTGTKEGCASGDCGACTVVVAKDGDDGLNYTPVNACIAPLGSLHGTELITVEDLKEGETWHPVQRAMIECHASQCGFCTPGFVMSLFALYHSKEPSSRAAILEALGGNLCRCTGYRPIIDAAEKLLFEDNSANDQFARRAQATADQLRAIPDTQSESAALESELGHYFRPLDTAHVARLLEKHPHARIIAGGTDLLLESTQSLNALPVLIDLCAVEQLHAITVNDESIRLGAAVTHRASQPAVLGDYPELAELIERFGSLQIRSQGTVAGNVANASPIGDWPPVLLALGGSVELQSSQGVRVVPIDDFFLDYRKTAQQAGEFISAVMLPRRAKEVFLRAYKISKRFEDDISSVCAVFALQLEGDTVIAVRAAFGGMAATPKRATALEQSLLGLDMRTGSLSSPAAAIAVDFQPISDARASSEYRLTVAARLLERLQAEFLGESPTRVHSSNETQEAVGHE